MAMAVKEALGQERPLTVVAADAGYSGGTPMQRL